MLSSGLPAAQLKSDLFKSLGHPLRVQVLEQLVAGERSVGSLAEAIGCELSNLSQQLGVLRRAGVVTTRRDGNTIFYAVRGTDAAELLVAAKRMVMANLTDSHALLRHLEQE
ncbi:MAG: metalloregulator ArsR/SmtB family transcription factor [Cryobacterium sp.]|uniref:ArsR/SmtB family transcription factor n=1 Tax=unclassified Cryobacterium TaxID=2649013 RepID=UPI0018C9FCFE|nr:MULTISPECIES: metalloregulator ArsR/SmtB family transcription factor [unclassified Cryobacterium]MCY7405716.1 metalloregulator ArsR/SmtB family transcription factor [Cryobacterium sp.]MEC5155144.1 DNA-binding transcriptional ArsR family regulator [Cryobacterium sp. CAN_C3]